MATKKKMNEEVQAPEVGMTTEQTMEQTGSGDVKTLTEDATKKEGTDGDQTKTQAGETPPDTQEDVAAATEESSPVLESLSVLADRHRVPSWQQAALLRFMDWTDDRLVSDAEYRAALDNLKYRRIGGGRR